MSAPGANPDPIAACNDGNTATSRILVEHAQEHGTGGAGPGSAVPVREGLRQPGNRGVGGCSPDCFGAVERLPMHVSRRVLAVACRMVEHAGLSNMTSSPMAQLCEYTPSRAVTRSSRPPKNA